MQTDGAKRRGTETAIALAAQSPAQGSYGWPGDDFGSSGRRNRHTQQGVDGGPQSAPG